MTMITFGHTKDTIAKKREATGNSIIRKSFVGNVTMTDVKIQSWGGTDKALNFTMTRENGESERFVSIRFINNDGTVNEFGLDIINDIMMVTGAKFNGENPEVFENKVIDVAVQVRAKEKGKGAGFPYSTIKQVYKDGKSIKEYVEKKEAKSRDYWIMRFEDDQPISLPSKGVAPLNPTAQAVSDNPFDGGSDDEFPF